MVITKFEKELGRALLYVINKGTYDNHAVDIARKFIHRRENECHPKRNHHLFRPECTNIVLKELKEMVQFADKYGEYDQKVITLEIYHGPVGNSFKVIAKDNSQHICDTSNW